MKKHFPYSRRDFLKFSTMAALGTTSLVGVANPLLNTDMTDSSGLEISIFSNHLQFLDYKDMSEAVKEMGFDGVDLTVRPWPG